MPVATLHLPKKETPKKRRGRASAISPEINKWVELIKAMPDIRLEKIHPQIPNISSQSKISVTAQKIVDSGF